MGKVGRAFGALLVAWLVLPPGSCAAAPAGDASADARRAVQRMMAAYAGARDYRGTCLGTLFWEMGSAQLSVKTRPVPLTYRRPGMYRTRASWAIGAAPAVELWSDGAETYASVSQPRIHQRARLPLPLRDAVASELTLFFPGPHPPLRTDALMLTGVDLLDGATTVELVGSEVSPQGRAAQLIAVTSADGTVTKLWIDSEDSRLWRTRITYPPAGVMASEGPDTAASTALERSALQSMSGGTRLIAEFAFRDVALNSGVAESEVVFKPPAGATEVDFLLPDQPADRPAIALP